MADKFPESLPGFQKMFPDDASILTALGAVVVVELDRFGQTIEQFTRSLMRLKAARDAEQARQKRENS